MPSVQYEASRFDRGDDDETLMATMVVTMKYLDLFLGFYGFTCLLALADRAPNGLKLELETATGPRCDMRRDRR